MDELGGYPHFRKPRCQNDWLGKKQYDKPSIDISSINHLDYAIKPSWPSQKELPPEMFPAINLSLKQLTWHRLAKCPSSGETVDSDQARGPKLAGLILMLCEVYFNKYRMEIQSLINMYVYIYIYTHMSYDYLYTHDYLYTQILQLLSFDGWRLVEGSFGTPFGWMHLHHCGRCPKFQIRRQRNSLLIAGGWQQTPPFERHIYIYMYIYIYVYMIYI